MSQGSTVLPTASPVPGLTALNDMNAALAALLSANAGNSAPANGAGGAPTTGQFWLDTATTPYTLRMYGGTAWAAVGTLSSAGVWTPAGTSTTPGFGAATDLASAATTDLGSIGSHFVNVTGTTGITSFGSSAATSAPVYLVTFAGALTLTHNASSLILPNAQNITTAAGDALIAKYLGAGNWQVLGYFAASGKPVFPIGTLPYASDVQITVPTTATISFSVSNSVLSDSAGRTVRLYNVSVTSNITASGVNGLDSGTVAANTFYYVWMIYNPTTTAVAGLFSTSPSSPTLPSGYTYALYLGDIKTDANSHIVTTKQVGKVVQYASPFYVGAGGLGTVQVAGNGFAVPANAQRVLGFIYATSGSINIAPNSSYASLAPVSVFAVSGANGSGAFDFVLESASLVVGSSTGNNYTYVRGWVTNAPVL